MERIAEANFDAPSAANCQQQSFEQAARSHPTTAILFRYARLPQAIE